MELRSLIAIYLGITVEKREINYGNLTEEQEDYLSDLRQVQLDMAELVPSSVVSFLANPDNSLEDFYDFGEDMTTEAWFLSLGSYVTQSNLQGLLDHTTESWYRSYTSENGQAGPLETLASQASAIAANRKLVGAALTNTPPLLVFIGGLALALI